MNYAEIISLGDTLDVSLKGDVIHKYRVSKCDNGYITLTACNLNKGHANYKIYLTLKFEENNEKKTIHPTNQR